MQIDGVDAEAVFGCVPANAVDNISELSALVGEEKAKAIVTATGFTTRRIAPAGTDVIDIALPAARAAIGETPPDQIGGIIAVSFSNRDRFPALATRLQHALALPCGIVAYDIAMACSGWIYGLFAAAQLVRACGRKVLLVDGDVQSAWIDRTDPNTLAVMGDGASATLLSPGDGKWEFSFLTDGSGASTLMCRDRISMDGFGVFRFVAGPVRRFLQEFISGSNLLSSSPSTAFVPHQANMYMVRQLSEAIGLRDGLVCGGETFANTGSCSAAISLALHDVRGPALLAGFGAGLSAGAAATSLGPYRKGMVEA